MDITVEGISGSAYRINLGSHQVVVDQPVAEGGAGLGPTPTDLFVAGLAACAAYYAGRFLARRGLDAGAIRLACSYDLSHDRPARVEHARLTLELPAGLPGDVRAAALRAAEHCTVHNSLKQPPEVTIDLAEVLAAA